MRNFSIIRRAPNIVDALIPLQAGVDTYRFAAAQNFDGSFTDIQDVPVQGFLDKAIVLAGRRDTLTVLPNQNSARFAFDPATYNVAAGITDTVQFWLRMTPVTGGTPGTPGPLGLVLPHALHTSPGRFNIAGTAPSVTVPNARVLELPWGMQNFLIRVESGGGDLGIAWDEGAPETIISAGTSETIFDAVQPRLIVRGIGGTADFTTTFFSAFPQ